MIWDRENSEWLSSLPCNRYRIEYGGRLSGVSDTDWDDDRIGNSSHESMDYKSRSHSIKRAKELLTCVSNVSYSRVIEIEAIISEDSGTAVIEWEGIEADPIWN